MNAENKQHTKKILFSMSSFHIFLLFLLKGSREKNLCIKNFISSYSQNKRKITHKKLFFCLKKKTLAEYLMSSIELQHKGVAFVEKYSQMTKEVKSRLHASPSTILTKKVVDKRIQWSIHDG